MGDTAIGWTHRPGTRGRTWNPVRGCRRKSAGCQHCYAEVQAARIVRMGKGKSTPYDGLVRVVDGEARWTGEISIDADRLAEPLRWREPSTVFVDSMSDLFYDRRADEHIAAVFGVAAACPQHTFLILTKYADRMRAWFEWARGPLEDTFTMQQRGIASAPNTARALLDAAYEYLGKARKPELDAAWHSPAIEADPWPLRNVWIGVSVENQQAADERIPDLLATPAAIRFLSCEPLLGPVDVLYAAFNGADSLQSMAGIGWLIDGCESGKEARPARPEWFASLEEQCRAAGVAYFHKQEMIGGKLKHDFPGRQQFPEAR